MKLLAIRGCNLASLAEPFEIDLTAPPLATTGLFAIVGPTGAGKSTLLDALCLALYGALPRLAGAPRGGGSDEALSLSDPRNALRQGAGQGFAEVDFLGRAETAAGGAAGRRRYRARWEAWRARGKPDGALQPARMSLIDLETGTPLSEKLAETRAAIADRVGLSFDQFKRSALLAQGDFEAFLAADAGDRALLLERITGGAIFGEISKAAHERMAQERREIEALEAGAAAHRPLEPEARAAAENRLAATAAALKEANTRRDALEAVERHLQEGARLLGAESAAAESQREASDRLDEVSAAAAAGLAEAAAEIDVRQAALAAEDAARPWGRALAEQEAAIAAALDQAARAAGALKALSEEAAALGEARARQDATLADLGERREAARAAVETKADDAEKARAALAALDPARLDQQAVAAAEAAQALSRLARPQERWRSARAAAGSASQRALAARAAARRAAEIEAAAAAALPAAEVSTRTAQERLDRWRAALSDAAASFRAALKDGEPCPVCGARDHAAAALTRAAEDAASEEALRFAKATATRDALVARRAAAVAETESQSSAAEAAEAEAARAATEIAAAAKAARAALAPWPDLAQRLGSPELARLASRAKAALRRREAEDDPQDEAAEALATAAQARLDSLESAQATLRAARSAVEASETARRDAEADLSRLGEAIEAARARRDALVDKAAAIEARRAAAREDGAAAAGLLDRVFAGFQEDWRRRPFLETRQRVAEEAAAARDRAAERAALTDRGPRIDAERTALAELLAGRARTPAEPSRADTETSPSTSRASAPRAVPSDAPGFAETRAAADALARAETRLETAVEARRQWRAAPPEGAAPFLDAPDALPVVLDDARAAQTEAAEAAEAAAGALKEDDAVRARLGAAERALEKRREAAAVWLRLDALIGSADGSKFRKFAQSLTLRALARLATRRLRDLAPRYALEAAPSDPADPDLALVAVDRDMGDVRRPVRQLSGGERFLTSLALALALADLSSEQGVVVESLFIDEGFGALDGDSLGMALSALEALQATGRQVGVVTHVEALSERIAARVAVSPRGGGRSVVRTLDL